MAMFDAILHFLKYAATYPNAAIQYHPSDMRLVHWSDASYLSESNARSRAGELHYLTNHGTPTDVPPKGAIDVISTIIPTVVASAGEAELAGLFLNAQQGTASCTTLADLGYVQPPTPNVTDNTTAKELQTYLSF